MNVQGDNKVPGVVRDNLGRKGRGTPIEFLSFEDWDSRKENEATDWVVVARTQVDEIPRRKSDFFTFSALAKLDDQHLKELVDKPGWEVDLELGHPTFYRNGAEGPVRYDSGAKLEKDGIVFSPFVFLRSSHGYEPSRFELVQDFMLYHDVFHSAEKSEYQRIDEDGETHSVVRVVQEGKNLSVLVDAHDLKDYLAANRCHLVRYHDNIRWTADDVPNLGGGKHIQKELKGEVWCFSLWIGAETLSGWKNVSILRGKDVVRPYSEPDRRHTSFVSSDDEREYAEFIIGRDKQGRLIESTCDESKLSNYFSDLGTPHVLTPVYFKREVLARYYQEPKRFRVVDSYVTCLDLWGIDFDITKEGLVQVWLYDLGHIPHKEQLYWRGFNVEPKGKITEYRWRRDFLAEFADSDDPIYHFKKAFEELQAQSMGSHGTCIFLELDEQDKHVYSSIHLPLTEEPGEFDAQIQSLAKITVDSLNVEFLEKKTGGKIDGKTIKGSIDLLALYLSQSKLSGDETTSVVRALSAIQSLRSTGVAHRKGEKFRHALKRIRLEGIPNSEKMRKLLIDATSALLLLRAAIESKS
jgi:hypothetical protein